MEVVENLEKVFSGLNQQGLYQIFCIISSTISVCFQFGCRLCRIAIGELC